MNSVQIPQIENISSIVDKIKKKSVSIVELTKKHIELAKELNPRINAFITILEDQALARANELQKLLDEGSVEIENMKLLGAPFTVKDLYLVKDTRTTFASRLMEDFIAPYTSTVVQKCLEQGAILIGKTNCDPWGFGGSGENSGFGPTKHPLDFSKTPGGSSSGSAASLLAGVGYFSLGTDTGGSVRLPASFCGLFGYKPTYGRNSRYGIGAMGSSFDTPAFFTRHIEDTILLEEIMEGKDINDATTSKTKNVEKKEKLKLGIPKEFFIDGIEDSVKEKINLRVEKLRSQGFEVVEVSIPSMKFALAVYYVLVPAEISSNRARYDGVRFGKKVSENYEQNLVESRSQFLEAEVKRRIMIGTYSLSAGYADQFYKKASRVRTKLKKEFNKAFEQADVLITPVSPSTAFELGAKSQDPVQMYLVDIFTVTANLVGIPGISVPIGEDEKGMPIGMQLMSQKWDDKNLLEFVKDNF